MHEHVVVEAVLVVPQLDVAATRNADIARAMPKKCSRNLVAIVSHAGLNDAISTAIVSMVRQKRAIQLVASDSSSRQPGGSAAERSNSPMLSMPRKPPSNRFEPSASLRLTHQPKLSSSLPNTRVRKSWSRRPSMR